MKSLYIFIHIPKTGGSSLNKNIKNQINECEFSNIKDLESKDKDMIFFITGHEVYYGVHKQFNNKNPYYIIFLREPAKRIESQYNHDMKRIKSDKKPLFKKWYKSQIKDELCFLLNKKYKGIFGRKTPSFTNSFISKFNVGNSKFLKMTGFKILKLINISRDKEKELENAKKLLDKCSFICFTENLDKEIPKILKFMNLSENKKRHNVNNNKFILLDNKIKEKINKDNPYDCELIKYKKEFKEILSVN